MNRHAPVLSWYLLAILAMTGLSAPLHAAPPPRDEALRLVPEDMGLCLLVQDLRGHTAALADSPFAVQMRASVLGKMIAASPEVGQLTEVDKVLRQQLGTDWPQLRDEILGDAVVMAYRPAPPGGKPEQEQSLFLVRARDSALLAKLITRLNEAQKKSGDLKELKERAHNGVKYFYRAERDKPPYYYWLRGSMLAVSPQEDVLQRVIDLDTKAPAENPPLSRKLRDMRADGGLIALWVNPRAFDAELQAKAKALEGSEAAFLTNFLIYWKALDDVALFVNMQQSLEVGVTARARPKDLPRAAQQFLETGTPASELWSTFPEDALVAVAGRVDLAALTEMVGEFLTPEARKNMQDAMDRGPLGKFGGAILPNLGPDVGFCLTAPTAQDKSWLPQGVWALRVQGTAGQTIFDSLNFFAGLGVLDFNKKNPTSRLDFKSVTQDKVEVRYFVGGKLPVGVQPAYALKAGYLVMASSPEVIQRFNVVPLKGPPEEVLLLRASLRTLAEYAKVRRDPLVDFLADKDHITKEEATGRLDAILTGVKLFQSVELTQRPSPGQTVLTLRLRTMEPLRK